MYILDIFLHFVFTENVLAILKYMLCEACPPIVCDVR